MTAKSVYSYKALRLNTRTAYRACFVYRLTRNMEINA